MSSQLFYNPIHIANLLEAKGCKLAKKQHKGPQHKTLEHKAAETIRHLVRDGYEPEALKQAKHMLAQEHHARMVGETEHSITKAGRDYWYNEYERIWGDLCDLSNDNRIYRIYAFIILIECLVWALLIALEKGVSLY